MFAKQLHILRSSSLRGLSCLLLAGVALTLSGCDLANEEGLDARNGELPEGAAQLPDADGNSVCDPSDPSHPGKDDSSKGSCPDGDKGGDDKGKKGKKGKKAKGAWIDCRRESVKVYDSCIDSGKDEKECKSEAVQHFRTCIDQAKKDGKLPGKKGKKGKKGDKGDHCPGKGSDKGGQCPGDKGKHFDPECAADAKAVFDQCVDDGGDEKDCRKKSRETYRECLEEKNPEFKKKSEAIRECKAEAASSHQSCIDAGGKDPDCKIQAKRDYWSCLEGKAPEVELNPERIACHKDALNVLDECLKDGGEMRKCRRERMKSFRRCMKG